MHQTTVRFGRDLWRELEREAGAAGVSVAQFVREAAVARLAQNALQRPQLPPEPLGAGATAGSHAALDNAAEIALDSAAVWSQSQQARSRSRELREEAEAARTARRAAQAARTAETARSRQLVASDKRPPA